MTTATMTQEYLDSIAMLMDDDLREELHCSLPLGTTPYEWYTKYCEAHNRKFAGEDFARDTLGNMAWEVVSQ